jgi:hypothetical protein
MLFAFSVRTELMVMASVRVAVSYAVAFRVCAECTVQTSKRREHPRRTPLVTRMAALQAEQRRETQWHLECEFPSKNAHRAFSALTRFHWITVLVSGRPREVLLYHKSLAIVGSNSILYYKSIASKSSGSCKLC